MKISFLRIAGFRGIAEEIELPFPSGFLVISGRNGSGKTTICNAIEFALRGEIRAIPGQSDKPEKAQDYLWWRGPHSPKKRSVSLGILKDSGEAIEIVRNPEGTEVTSRSDIESLLCDDLASMEDCLEHLCRTSILRDEELVKTSLDMSELERFDFVQSTLGGAGYSRIENRSDQVHQALKRRLDKAISDYSRAREEVTRLISQISEARLRAVEPEIVAKAESFIQASLEVEPAAQVEILEQGISTAANMRADLDSLEDYLEKLSRLRGRQQELRTDSFSGDIEKYRSEIRELEIELEAVTQNLDEMNHALASYREDHPEATSLANLLDHGRKYELHGAKCPLCGLPISQDDFNAHLDVVAEKISSVSASIGELASNRNMLITEIEEFESRISELTESLGSALGEEEAIIAEIRNMRQDKLLAPLEILDNNGDILLAPLLEEIEDRRKRIRDLNQALGVIESARAYDQIADLDQELSTAREAADELEREMQRFKDATAEAKNAYDTARRLIREDIDDQLSELRPLLEEIYLRLKPHSDWRKISYQIRGDVRRFLSLDLGEGVNPNYIFSSGQRRIAGLAFLLAVHLSRWWCKLDTLVLDDPVQHIDDFRALHLAETLGAIRRTGRQVVCTVEDRDLADVLCRRLRSSTNEPGLLVELEYRHGRGVRIASKTEIKPVLGNVLMAA